MSFHCCYHATAQGKCHVYTTTAKTTHCFQKMACFFFVGPAEARCLPYPFSVVPVREPGATSRSSHSTVSLGRNPSINSQDSDKRQFRNGQTSATCGFWSGAVQYHRRGSARMLVENIAPPTNVTGLLMAKYMPRESACARGARACPAPAT